MVSTTQIRKRDVAIFFLSMTVLYWHVIVVGASGRGRAKRAVCVSNVRQLTVAWQLFADDNAGTLVGGNTRHPNDWVLQASGANFSIEAKKAGIRTGALFPYVRDVRVYHCPGDLRLCDPRQQTFRSYSIVDGMNGEAFGVEPIRSIAEIEDPSCQYVFVEEADPRGCNRGSWCMDAEGETWIDPLANWHARSSTLGFADGHAEAHGWVDESTIEMADLGGAGDTRVFYYPVPADEGEDVRYMLAGYTIRRTPRGEVPPRRGTM